MPTTTTTVSRLQLAHPDLGHDGGTNLHTKVRNAWTKIGDNMDSRFFTSDALANAASVDFIHNFKTAFDELKINLYTRDTGTGELTRIETGGSPDLADFTIAATPSFLTTSIRITNNTGGAVDIAAVVTHGKGAEVINDLEDVDTVTTPPEDGQALVWSEADQQFIPGASGDASFKVQSVAANGTTVIKGGYIIDDKGRELATYDGGGSASTDFGTDLTIDLDNLEPSPVNDTTYYLYIDDADIGASVTQTDTGRKVYGITETQLALLTTAPDLANLVRYTPIGFVRRATGAWSTTIFGTVAFRRHDDPSVVVSPIVYTLTKQLVGSIGSSSQIRAGHILDSNSFPSFTTETSFWNLRANANDGTSNARNLTNNGSTPFTATDLFGAASLAASLNGTSQYFSSTSTFLAPGDSNHSFGAWFKATDWTPSAVVTLIGQWNVTGNNRSIRVQLDTSGDLKVFTSTDGTANTSSSFTPSFTDNTWHHIALRYVASSNTAYLYVDGVQVLAHVAAGNIFTPASAVFSIGASGAGAEFFAGSIEEAFFTTDTLTDAEIRKLSTYRFDHSKNVPIANQLWTFNHYSGATGYATVLSSAIYDMYVNSIYVDFIDLDPTDSVEGKLQYMGMSAQTVPVMTFDRTFTSDPNIDVTPIDTYLADDPTSIEVWKYVSGKWSVIADGNSLIDVAATGNRAISGDLATTSPSVSEPVRVIISCAPASVSVTRSKVNVAGVFELQWTGYNKFVGGTHPDAYATLAAAIAAASAGDSILVMGSYSITAAETLNVADVKITFMPGVKVTITGAIATAALIIDAARAQVLGAYYLANFSGTLGAFMRFTSNAKDANIARTYIEAANAGLTVTQSFEFQASSARNFVSGSQLASAGTISTAVSDSGTDNDYAIRG